MRQLNFKSVSLSSCSLAFIIVVGFSGCGGEVGSDPTSIDDDLSDVTEPTLVPTPESTPLPTPETGMLRIESVPSGAAAVVRYGPDAGKNLGITPFYYDPTLNGGVTYMTLSKPGYVDSTGVVFKYMARLEFTVIYLNPIPSSNNGLLRIESRPSGADAVVKYGPDAGKHLGTTPFYYDPTLNGGVTYMTLSKPGYRDSTGVVFKYMTRFEFTVIYLNPIN